MKTFIIVKDEVVVCKKWLGDNKNEALSSYLNYHSPFTPPGFYNSNHAKKRGYEAYEVKSNKNKTKRGF